MWTEHGRPLTAIVQRVFAFAGLDMVRNQIIGTLGLIVALAVSSALTAWRTLRYLTRISPFSLLLVWGATAGAFANVFMAEWFRFEFASVMVALECFLMLAAVLLFDRERLKLWQVLAALVLLFLSVCGYQVFFEYFVIYSIMLAFLRSGMRFSKALLKRTLLILLAAGSTCLANIGLTKLHLSMMEMADYRYSSYTMELLITNIGLLIPSSRELMLKTDGLYPAYSVLLCALVPAAVFLISGIRKKLLQGWSIPYAVAASAGSYVMLYVPIAMNGYPFLNIRILIALFAWICMGMVWCTAVITVRPEPSVRGAQNETYRNIKETYRNIKWLDTAERILGALSIFLLLGLSVYGVQQYTLNIFTCNALDRMRVQEIGGVIDQYEEETGIAVSNIAVGLDASFSMYEDFMPYRSQQNGEFISSLVISNTYPHIFNYYLNRDLQLAPMDETINQTYFVDHDWDSFVPDEQMVFVGDTLYLAIY